MASKYKLHGPLGNAYVSRDFKRWVVVCNDDEELTLQRKKYAVEFVKTLLNMGYDAHIYEETVTRSIFADNTVKEDTFRIDITKRIIMEKKLNLLKKTTETTETTERS